MENLYIKSSKEEPSKWLNPRKGTVQFLLNYSKALRITEYGELKFETLLN